MLESGLACRSQSMFGLVVGGVAGESPPLDRSTDPGVEGFLCPAVIGCKPLLSGIEVGALEVESAGVEVALVEAQEDW